MNALRLAGRIGAVGVLWAAAGCTTIYSEREEREALASTQLEYLTADMKKSRERMDGVDARLDELERQAQELRGSGPAQARQTSERIEGLERQLRALNEARTGDRQALLDDLGKRVTEAVNAVAARSAPPPVARSAPRVDRGYEHTVKEGETLSAIAAAYRVRSTDILKANKLANPNNLRVGQKLFIPEAAGAKE